MINYKYCPQCKKDLDLTGEFPYCPNCNLTIYKNSKPCTSVLIIKNDKVLLSKRGIEPYKGDWDTVGGFLKSGEHPEVGALRETLEETGLVVKLTGLLGIYMDKYGENGYDTQANVYLAEISSGELKAMDDVSSLEWVDIKNNDIHSQFESVNQVLSNLKKLYS